MAPELPDTEFRQLWQRLKSLGLNAYESRSYLILLGHSSFKALDLAERANVPRQKIYEVLDSLIEKGFAQVVQERTKLFSAIPPDQAIRAYLDRRAKSLEAEIREQTAAAQDLVHSLTSAVPAGPAGRGTLDFLRIVHDPRQAATQFAKWLGEARNDYLEFSRPPHATGPLDAARLLAAHARGVACRVIVERAASTPAVAEYQAAGAEVRLIGQVPMKLALFDAQRGMLALLDPVVTRPAWTTLVFEHPGMAAAMRALFEDYWNRAHKSAASA